MSSSSTTGAETTPLLLHLIPSPSPESSLERTRRQRERENSRSSREIVALSRLPSLVSHLLTPCQKSSRGAEPFRSLERIHPSSGEHLVSLSLPRCLSLSSELRNIRPSSSSEGKETERKTRRGTAAGAALEKTTTLALSRHPPISS